MTNKRSAHTGRLRWKDPLWACLMLFRLSSSRCLIALPEWSVEGIQAPTPTAIHAQPIGMLTYEVPDKQGTVGIRHIPFWAIFPSCLYTVISPVRLGIEVTWQCRDTRGRQRALARSPKVRRVAPRMLGVDGECISSKSFWLPHGNSQNNPPTLPISANPSLPSCPC